jgi:hypothetical protein
MTVAVYTLLILTTKARFTLIEHTNQHRLMPVAVYTLLRTQPHQGQNPSESCLNSNQCSPMTPECSATFAECTPASLKDWKISAFIKDFHARMSHVEPWNATRGYTSNGSRNARPHVQWQTVCRAIDNQKSSGPEVQKSRSIRSQTSSSPEAHAHHLLIPTTKMAHSRSGKHTSLMPIWRQHVANTRPTNNNHQEMALGKREQFAQPFVCKHHQVHHQMTTTRMSPES